MSLAAFRQRKTPYHDALASAANILRLAESIQRQAMQVSNENESLTGHLQLYM